MNCDWFEMRLDELLDERLPPDCDAALNEHAEACPRCAQMLSDHHALLEAIEALVRPEPRGDLAARILAAVGRDLREPVSLANVSQAADTAPPAGAVHPSQLPQRLTMPRRGLPHLATWIAAAVAAMVLVAVGVMEWGAAHRSGAVAESKRLDVNMRKIAIEKPAVNTPTEHRAALVSASVVGVHSLAGLIGPQPRMLMEQMTDGLKPVTHSMSAALNALRRTLPGSETPARSS
jgi:anti-sigma factor RsiW